MSGVGPFSQNYRWVNSDSFPSLYTGVSFWTLYFRGTQTKFYRVDSKFEESSVLETSLLFHIHIRYEWFKFRTEIEKIWDAFIKDLTFRTIIRSVSGIRTVHVRLVRVQFPWNTSANRTERQQTKTQHLKTVPKLLSGERVPHHVKDESKICLNEERRDGLNLDTRRNVNCSWPTYWNLFSSMILRDSESFTLLPDSRA